MKSLILQSRAAFSFSSASWLYILEARRLQLQTACNKNPTFGCPKNYSPVCASNGVTYSNLCTFCKANRKSHGKITFQHNGSCRRILSTGGTKPRLDSAELLGTAA
ncbi:serine protease inhibitor Kazal-type 1-like isoform X4 [Saccopteryx leptura]|uniref:serine protease inhibitor Kazal-type 1-like isoform X4 n=1 Tax=Saccopteryx leptura TaxID=249018 RepID=UPI00339C072B